MTVVGALILGQVHELEAEMDGLNKTHSQFAQVRSREVGAPVLVLVIFRGFSRCARQKDAPMVCRVPVMWV